MEAGQSGLSEIGYGRSVSYPGKIIKKNFIWHVIKYVLYYVWGCHLRQLILSKKPMPYTCPGLSREIKMEDS